MQGLSQAAKQIYQKQPNEKNSTNKDLNQIKKTNVILRMKFVESLDLILAACEDNSIYVWGFDQEAVNILKNMKYEEKNKTKKKNKNTTFRDDQPETQTYNYFEKINYIQYLNSLNTSTNQYETNSFFKNSSVSEKNPNTIKNDESESVIWFY